MGPALTGVEAKRASTERMAAEASFIAIQVVWVSKWLWRAVYKLEVEVQAQGRYGRYASFCSHYIHARSCCGVGASARYASCQLSSYKTYISYPRGMPAPRLPGISVCHLEVTSRQGRPYARIILNLCETPSFRSPSLLITPSPQPPLRSWLMY